MKKLMIVAGLAIACTAFVGCLTRATAYTKTTNKDGSVTESRVSIFGTGDKASEVAAEGLFADGTAEDLGAGVKKANASQQSTGIDGTLNGLGALMGGMAQMMAASQGVKIPASSVAATPSSTSAQVDASDSEVSTPTATTANTATALPSESVVANAAQLAAKMSEAKASGKPLVVIASDPGCGYCAKLDKILDADAAFSGRSDIVLYRETSDWASNQAAKWTGGGALPVLRVTQWNAAGAAVCDKKVNRPQSVADIEAALTACSR